MSGHGVHTKAAVVSNMHGIDQCLNVVQRYVTVYTNMALVASHLRDIIGRSLSLKRSERRIGLSFVLIVQYY